MRILITGSRDWPYPEVVYRELDKIADESQYDVLTVVEGACIYGGADEFAFSWALDKEFAGDEVKSERHPAANYGHPTVRNQFMVDLGADICLAFRFNKSRGTTDCINKARKAGIPVRIIDIEIVEADKRG